MTTKILNEYKSSKFNGSSFLFFKKYQIGIYVYKIYLYKNTIKSSLEFYLSFKYLLIAAKSDKLNGFKIAPVAPKS